MTTSGAGLNGRCARALAISISRTNCAYEGNSVTGIVDLGGFGVLKGFREKDVFCVHGEEQRLDVNYTYKENRSNDNDAFKLVRGIIGM